MTHESQAAPEPLLTAANLLTLSRVPLAAALWLAPRRRNTVLAIAAAAALSDAADGWVARRQRRRDGASGPLAGPRGLGAWLDPVCDKLFMASLLTAVRQVEGTPSALLGLLATREVVLVPLTLLYHLGPARRAPRAVDLRAGRLGKAATVLQFGAVFGLLLRSPLALPLALGSAALGLAATASYVGRGLRALHA